MLVFFDTEFTDWRNPKLISIGFTVRERGGQSLYLELSDTYRLEDCSAFVNAEVLPQLAGGECLVTCEEAVAQISSWFSSFDVDNIDLVCDFPEYDMTLLKGLFRDEWPTGVSHRAIRFDTSGLGWHRRALMNAISQVAESHVKAHGQHHALVDAQRLKAVWERLTHMGRDPRRLDDWHSFTPDPF